MNNSDTEQNARIFAFPTPFKAPLARKVFSILQGGLEKALCLSMLNDVYMEIADETDASGFMRRSLESLGVRYEVSESEIASIPTEGPLVIVSNHPFGGLEGLILGALLPGVRPDTKIMANYLLSRIPQLRGILIAVDPFETKDSTTKNLKPLRQALAWLRAGHALTVFPSGTVSSLNLQERRIVDPRWHEAVAGLVRKSGASVLPVFFEGANSALFQAAGLLNAKLRTALLPHELLKKRNSTVKIRIGRVVPFQRLKKFSDNENLLSYLRMRTYMLQHRNHKKPAARGCFMIFRKQVKAVQEILAAGPGSDVIAQEIDRLPRDALLMTSGEYRVFSARAHQIPNALFEIGRLREISFRQTQEGTGKSVDLDRCDLYYTHLFVWDDNRKNVVGAYRLGRVDEIVSRFGKKGLYTSTLFDYKESFLRHIDCGLELGRSFVRAEYQKLYQPLLLLWKGIAAFVARNPSYTTLFGPVSISDRYSQFSKQLMVSYLTMNHFAPDMARFVRPRTPLSGQSKKRLSSSFPAMLPADIEELSSIISDVESDRKGLPILLKHYVKLGGRLMGFNLDPAFGNVLDGLIVVDLLKCDRKVLDRFMGEAQSAQFFDYHQEPPRRNLAS
ncbi:MAG TPA: GNAT family N-acyltransferase [Syntrophorhabdaceae bacterium]|nr:GNAT family N-acyltransferase [Syntrophorhabdaceae bacterium]